MNNQIQEIARLIFDFDEVENNEMKIAKWLYDNGCRIINEDEIYMSKEEWEQRAYINAIQNELCKKCRDMIAKETVPVVMYEQARKETAKEIITFIKTLKVEEDGRHQWRDNHNDCIDKVILTLNWKFVNGVEVK